MIITCSNCGVKKDRPTGDVNRAKKEGRKLYCSRKCSGIANRSHKSKEQLIEEKRIYDAQYRQREGFKEKARANWAKNYDPVKAAVYRKKRMHKHIAYCRTPEYKKWKSDYDKKYRAKKQFGNYYESALLLIQINTEIRKKESFTERATNKGTLNKWQTRRRSYERIKC